MNDTFLPADPVSSREEIIQELYDRLRAVRHADEIHVDLEHLQRSRLLAKEADWLSDLLDKIERS